MLTPPRVLVGLATLCCLSLLAVIFCLDGHSTIAYLGLAGYAVGAAGICGLLCAENMGKLPPVLHLPALPDLTRLHRALVLGLVALFVFVGLPPLVRLVYPSFGGFAPDTINAATLGAFQFFASLTMAYAAWRWLFPGLYAYAAETMEGKILESITSDLLQLLPGAGQWNTTDALASLAERRRIATLTFTVRCVRFIFSVAPFVYFCWQANHALASALIAVPSGAPVL